MSATTKEDLIAAGLLDASGSLQLTDKGRNWLHTLEDLANQPPVIPSRRPMDLEDVVYGQELSAGQAFAGDDDDFVRSTSGIFR